MRKVLLDYPQRAVYIQMQNGAGYGGRCGVCFE